ncbi:GntR family transcriptional regulator [Pseudarthrobacter sp. J64]|uniref:GntR family transcriptional regulator n=1 Tax=Pseudarthrobacter sp. J64 TaxID=3116485 RepID=UPI002E81DC34|nr:GntR family transcriptional regulator [Pseudarthrobacter sp. J64]MEE2568035.1 GntR family transcriptional regulator [Pseudarthrobacter sp. J64]
MDPLVSVDLGSATPPYEQIRSQISALIATGALAPGDRLPTVRSLAADLGLAGGTIARAYKELEAAGQIQSRRRAGTVVAPAAPGGGAQAPAAGVPAEVIGAVDLLISAGREARLSDELLLDLVRGQLRRTGTERRLPDGKP